MARVFTFLFTIILSINIAYAQWSQITDYAGGATDGAPAFTIGNYAYVGGGLGSKEFYKFDPSTDSWTKLSDIPSGFNRGWAFAFVINGKGYVCGGDKTGNFAVYKDVQEYNPTTDTWTKKADLPIAMDGAFACSVNGKGYVIGGFNGSAAVSSVYEYDPVADTWTSKASYPGGQAIFPSGFVINNKIYVGMGSASGMAGSKLFYEYNPATNTWAQRASYPGSSRQACIGFAVGNTGYIGGGEENYSVQFTDFYKYNPISDSWTKDNTLNITTGEAAAWCSSFVVGNTAYYGLGATFTSGSLGFSKKFFKANISALGIDNNSKNQKVKIYPNPAKEKLNVEVPENFHPTSFIIIDSMGKKYTNYTYINNELNIAFLSSGVYFLEVQSENQVIRSKFIVQ